LKNENEILFKKNRPGLIISSTSWTKDEDFSILLNSIVDLDKKVSDIDNFPNLQFVITGFFLI
jgi:beta-1,4-mannosyltransferase